MLGMEERTMLKRTLLPLFGLLALASVAPGQSDAYLSTLTLSNDNPTTTSVSGVERIRIQPDGADIYYTFWPNPTNTKICDVTAVSYQPGSNDKVALLTVTSVAQMWNGMAVEIRADDETTVKATGIIKSVGAFPGLTPYSRRSTSGSTSIVNVVLGAAPGTALAADDTIFCLTPSRSDDRGVYIPEAAEAGGGFIVNVPGPAQADGVLVGVRASGASTGEVRISAYFPPPGY